MIVRQNFRHTHISKIVDMQLKTIERLRILSGYLLWAIYIQYLVHENRQSNIKPWHISSATNKKDNKMMNKEQQITLQQE